MKGEVVVHSPEDFETWKAMQLAEKQNQAGE
jgi:heme/copper-type cytochrome/quinol oxidase subunit 2